MRRQIGATVKADRLRALQALLGAQTQAFNQATVGRVLLVLLERAGRHPGQMVGRTPYLQAVHLPAPGAQPGTLIEVTIVESQPHSLAGAPLAAPAPEPQPSMGAAKSRRRREACA
jgi:tRNA-2-methylthio-N6-dimethylallyladenosine synthase